MSQLLSPDNKVMQFITKIATSAFLNALWLICCVPVFTIGASTTALFSVSIKMVRNEEGRITHDFFTSFKENFKQSTLIWLIMLFVGLLIGADGYVLYHLRSTGIFWTLLTGVLLVAAAGYLLVLMYIFPLQAKFANTTSAMFKNSVIVGMRFLLCTVLMAAIYAAMALVAIFIFTPILFFGMGLCALLCSYLLNGILLQLEEKAVTE